MSNNGEVKFSTTQRKLMAILQDGKPHTTQELRTCIHDDLADGGALRTALTYLRRRLRPSRDITTIQLRKNTYYALISIDISSIIPQS